MSADPDCKSSERSSTASAIFSLVAMVAIAVLVRGWMIQAPGLGHDPDLGIFIRWIRGLHSLGIGGFYHSEKFCDYPPLGVLLFRALGEITNYLTGGSATDLQLRTAVKCVAGLGDLAIGGLLLWEGKRLLGWAAARVAATLYLLNPAVLFNSVFWGQVDSIYTAFSLAALIMVAHRRWVLVGFLIMAGVGAKFQAVVIVPLVVFEVLRLGGATGMARFLVGAVLAVGVILAPFIQAGATKEVLSRSYVRVIGQYHERSKSAFNLWQLVGDPEAVDTAIPAAIVRWAAAGQIQVQSHSSWLLRFNWRTISLLMLALFAALILSLYSIWPGNAARYAAAGALNLAFFLFPTEIHERYLFPALAFLPLWALVSRGRERLYWLLSILLILNLAASLPPGPIAPQIAAGLLAVLFGLLLGLRSGAPKATPEIAVDPIEAFQSGYWKRCSRVFRWVTATAWSAGLGCSAWLAYCSTAPPPGSADALAIWLDRLTPRSVQQGWRLPTPNRDVSDSHMQLGDVIYLRGLGTHAPAKLEYDVPVGAVSFAAVVGVDAAAGEAGSAIIRIELDGQTVYSTERLTAADGGQAVQVAIGEAKRLAIVVDPTADGNKSDHVDLGLARFQLASR